MKIDYSKLKTGMLIGVVGIDKKQTGMWWVYNLMNFFIEPEDDERHFLLLGRPHPDGKDWQILEAEGWGVEIDKLSSYLNCDLRFYWPQRYDESTHTWIEATVEDGIEAWETAKDMEGKKYDYGLFAWLAVQVPFIIAFNIITKKDHWKVRPSQFIYVKNKAFICTEVVHVWAEIKKKLYDFTKGAVCIPCTIKEAVNAQRLKICQIFLSS